MEYMWIFSESNESWYCDSIFSCAPSKEKAQKIWDELKSKEGKDGSVYQYTVIDIKNCRVLITVGRHQIINETADYILTDEPA